MVRGEGDGGGLIKPAGNLSDMVIFILNAFFAGQLRSTDF